MRRSKSLFVRLAVAALVSGLSALLIVTVGPGFAEKPEDTAPSEQAAEQAHENAAEDSATEQGADVAASEDTEGAAQELSTAAAEEEAATESTDADKGGKPDVPPGQAEDEGSDLLASSASGNSSTSRGNAKPNEDTSQTGLPRGQEEDECTNSHHGDDNDFSGHGANQHGLYDNTCDGRASENGSGGGNANGRPCMGCVGNADDKNPRGQSPNHLGGKDHNAGYECDRNKGVGQGNPAHTDCPPTTIITICHSDDAGDTWRVVTDTRDDIEDILEEDGPVFAFVIDLSEGDYPEDCDSEEPPCVDKPNTPKDECNEVLVSICYQLNNGNWAVAEDIDEDDVDTFRNARIVPKGFDPDDCEDDVITICYQDDDGDWRIARDIDEDDIDDYDNAKIVDDDTDADECEEEEEVCPPGTDRAGLPMPRGGRDECDDDEVLPDVDDKKYCPKGTPKEGQPMPDDKDCGVTITVCPADSDRPMQVLPDGRSAEWCYDDEVQGEVIRNVPQPGMPQPNVQQKAVKPGVLPFTGASVLAFVVLALQLIAAGSLILRGRRA